MCVPEHADLVTDRKKNYFVESRSFLRDAQLNRIALPSTQLLTTKTRSKILKPSIF